MNSKQSIAEFKNSKEYQIEGKSFLYFDLWFFLLFLFQIVIIFPILVNTVCVETDKYIMMKDQTLFSETLSGWIYIFYTFKLTMFLLKGLYFLSKGRILLNHKACYQFMLSFWLIYFFATLFLGQKMIFIISLVTITMLLLSGLKTQFIRKKEASWKN